MPRWPRRARARPPGAEATAAHGASAGPAEGRGPYRIAVSGGGGDRWMWRVAIGAWVLAEGETETLAAAMEAAEAVLRRMP